MKHESENCRDCGTHKSKLKERPWSRRDKNAKLWYYQCKPCRTEEINKKIESYEWDELDTYAEDNVICPFCGQVHESDGESIEFYADGDHEFECSECENTFLLETNVSFSYTTTKI